MFSAMAGMAGAGTTAISIGRVMAKSRPRTGISQGGQPL